MSEQSTVLHDPSEIGPMERANIRAQKAHVKREKVYDAGFLQGQVLYLINNDNKVRKVLILKVTNAGNPYRSAYIRGRDLEDKKLFNFYASLSSAYNMRCNVFLTEKEAYKSLQSKLKSEINQHKKDMASKKVKLNALERKLKTALRKS